MQQLDGSEVKSEAKSVRRFARPPRYVFHLSLLLAVWILLWAASLPASGWFEQSIARDLPFKIRWATSEAAFVRSVASAPPPTNTDDWQRFEVPERIGTYKIISASRVGDGVVFYEASGDFFDDAGFAYLPSGPFDEIETGSFERPQFTPVGNDWYRWTASW